MQNTHPDADADAKQCILCQPMRLLTTPTMTSTSSHGLSTPTSDHGSILRRLLRSVGLLTWWRKTNE